MPPSATAPGHQSAERGSEAGTENTEKGLGQNQRRNGPCPQKSQTWSCIESVFLGRRQPPFRLGIPRCGPRPAGGTFHWPTRAPSTSQLVSPPQLASTSQSPKTSVASGALHRERGGEIAVKTAVALTEASLPSVSQQHERTTREARAVPRPQVRGGGPGRRAPGGGHTASPSHGPPWSFPQDEEGAALPSPTLSCTHSPAGDASGGL
ncbi:uncharacterized protein LOC121479424 isoform X4 [Vulpes lagopus]|uniref:uncharacterized protein LOC121479424 isoform X4 n=1 Tax=Vulpes lagopus TaxID=494514 RepID=UPI001BC93D28|nr:uncharacterized protein LOC121479424 isoform X4 [Vulpes lagopus]